MTNIPDHRSAPMQLAQLNIALPLEPLESDLLRDFVDQLDEVNTLAEAAPGYVWRLKTDDGDATAIRGFGDDRLIINMSVWESLDALRSFVFDGRHVEVMRRRREWFAKFSTAYAVLWWVPVGHEPTIAEAEERLASLDAHGPTAYAFTFRTPFESS